MRTLRGTPTDRLLIASALFLVATVARGAQVQVASSGPAPAAPNVPATAASTGFTESAATGDALHVIVGRSIFLDTAERVRRVYIANPLVLDFLHCEST